MKKVVVGLSGGVDSSVSAWLLKEQGYEVIGVNMEHLKPADDSSFSLEGTEDAKKVASALGIPFYVINYHDAFKSGVIHPFIGAYCSGRTPNPCVWCNRYVKWEALLRKADELGADYVATGHYAKVKRLENGRYCVAASATAKKDQTYALCALSQDQLKRTLMPLGDYTKDETRKIAARQGIPVANKPDSQEICFIPDDDYAGYIKENSDYKPQPGNFVDIHGNVLGKHKGIIHYTVGQRKGLGIAFGTPMYVVRIKPDTNEVVLGTNEETFGDTLYAGSINFMGQESFSPGEVLLAKIRYSHKGDFCRVFPFEKGLKCVFEKPQRAITPGQALVLYKEDYVVAGGIITADERFR